MAVREGMAVATDEVTDGPAGRDDRPGYVEEIRLDQIVRDAELQARAGGLDPDVVDDYAGVVKRGDKFRELLVVFRMPVGEENEGDNLLAAGFHRFAAYEKAGRESAPCEVRDGTRADAILYAAASNGQHGLRPSRADKRRMVTMALCARPAWTDRRIARVLGCVSNHLVADVRAELAAEAELEFSSPDAGRCDPGAGGNSPNTPTTDPGEATHAPPADPVGNSPNTHPEGQAWTSPTAPPAGPVGRFPNTETRVGTDGRRYQASKPRPSPPADPGPEAAHAPSAKLHVDGMGRDIPLKAWDVFADEVLPDAARQLRALSTRVKSATAWNPWLKAEWEQLRQVADNLDGARAFVVCRDCSGRGCAACLTSGFLPAWMRHELEAERDDGRKRV